VQVIYCLLLPVLPPAFPYDGGLALFEIPTPTMQDTDSNNDTLSPDNEAIHDDRLWRDEGWTARVIKNEDDDGWAVEMSRDGEREPALIGPWTMGRDKKNPKPLDKSAFNTLVKTASEFVRRSEQQLHAQLHKHVTIDTAEGRIKVTLDIVPDDDFPYADLSAWDEMGDMLAKVQTAPNYKLDADSAQRWVASGYRRPG
jgi:hypothetical protein